MGRSCAVLIGAVALAVLLPGTARADEFYKGRQISWILSADVGGGYASYARAFAPFFANHIPGKPNIVIQHMPGAGGIRAMSYFDSVAPKDGSTLGLVHSSVPFAPLFGIKGARFDPRRMHWIGSLDANTAICVAWHTSRIKTWADVLEKEFTVGGSGVGSQMETMPALLNKLFGTKMKVISGYRGGNEIYLAMERGEFARNERSRQVLQLFVAPQAMDRPILAPPGVPPARIAVLRTAFHAAMNDPGFIAEAKKQHIEIQEVDGDRVAKIIADAYALPPDIVKAATEAMSVAGAGSE